MAELAQPTNSFLSPSDTAKVFRKLKAQAANKTCFDCSTKNPNWTSIPFGIYICMDCSSTHRKMGTHISFVKSSVLDKWTQDHILYLVAGGNQKARDFFKQRGWVDDHSAANIKEKYTSKAAKLYQQHLQRESRLHMQALSEMISSPVLAPAASPILDNNQALDDLAAELLASKTPAPVSAKASSSSTATATSATTSKSIVSKPILSSSAIKKAQIEENKADEQEQEQQQQQQHHDDDEQQETENHEDVDDIDEFKQVNLPKKPSPRRVVIVKHQDKDVASQLTSVKLGDSKAKTAVRATTRSKTSALSTKPVAVSVAAVSSENSIDELDQVLQGVTFDKPKTEIMKPIQSVPTTTAVTATTTTPSSAAQRTTPTSSNGTNNSSNNSKTNNTNESPGEERLLSWKERQARHDAMQKNNNSSNRNVKTKSISSDKYFQTGAYAPTSKEDQERLSKFSNARAISSASFFGEEQQETHAEDDPVDIANLKDAVAEKGRQIKDMASGFISSIRGRYG